MERSHIILITLILSLCLVLSQAARRNISEITYRFTTCGSDNHDGPRVNSRCLQLYQEMNSPIVANENSFFRFEDSTFDGAQGFRIPKSGLYNVTIAGAIGGTGVCNPMYGRGRTVSIQVRLSTDYEYLVLVGQKGTSACEANPSHPLCESPPTNLTEAQSCNVTWFDFTSNLPNTFHRYGFNGGGGGGGASMIWPRLRRGEKQFTDLPIAIGPGGGGASAILDYDFVSEILSNLTAIGFQLQYPSTSSNETIYDYFVSAHSTQFDLTWTEGRRGNRPDGLNVVTSGAGGGWLSTIQLSLIDVDGKLLSQINDFAEGGFDCSSRIFSQQDSDIFTNVFGGFGGGGGGCGSGGGGGGYTGGHVFTNNNRMPGGGGDVGISNLTETPLVNTFGVFFNNDEGFVEMVATDCTCAGRCEVYPEEKEFECLCENGTSLAPDGSNCYEGATISVRPSTNPLTFTDNDNGETYIINGLIFTDTSVSILGLDVSLTLAPLSGSRVPEDELACAVVFVGSDTENVVLASNVVSENGRANRLTMLETTGNDPVAAPDTYAQLLRSPVIVTGAFLVTNGNCAMSGSFRMNISTEDVDIPPIQGLTRLAFENFGVSFVVATARNILGIIETTESTTIQTEPVQNVNVGLAIGLVIVVAVLIFALLGIIAVFIYFKVILKKRSKEVRTELLETSLSPVPVTPVSYAEGNMGFNTVQYEAVKDTETEQVEIDAVTGNQYSVVSLKSGASVGNSKNPYSTLTGDDKTYSSPVSLTSNNFTPRYGIIAPAIDFTSFNRERSNSSITNWDYQRSDLVYLRELGEGQFGKVLLMKAKNIAGYKGKIPVAVKTLTSRDPEVIGKFMEEAELMKKFSHPNIVSLLGISEAESDGDIDEDSSPLMILEYMPYGDLQSFLSAHKPNEMNQTSISEQHFRRFGIDISRALDFLSASGYVHRDVAARNCLIGPNLQIKIADFGLSRGVYDKDYYKIAGKAVLPVRWMAPECLLYGIFSAASDVWAYGVLLWEITSYGETPLDDMEVQEVVSAAQNKRLAHSRPDYCSDLLYDLMCQCHRHEAKQRPTFEELLFALISSQEEPEQTNDLDNRSSSPPQNSSQ